MSKYKYIALTIKQKEYLQNELKKLPQCKEQMQILLKLEDE